VLGLRLAQHRNLGFFPRQQHAVEVETDFWNFAETAATGGNVEVQKHEVFEGPCLKGLDLPTRLLSQGEVAAPQQGVVRRKAAGAPKVNQPGGFKRDEARHDCGSFPYFRAG
jgi:hypothetical protein